MFGFFKKNKKDSELSLIAPATGKIVPISEIPDPVFAQKMAGDGIGIDVTGDTIVAPADGTVSLIFKTKHAFAMTLNNGIELLVHVGLETVALNGEGFEQLIEQGTTVKAGTPILKIDRELIKSKGCPLVTPVLITNVDATKSLTPIANGDAVAGQTSIIEYTV
ncbi:PTS sugar transporter subunit IIA [Clostridium thermobutyricum]|uniref:PTS system, glucose subfamily, IIA component n=2 Tax=Clostridium thermobutyricum TaxID=29372 RepID=N9WLV1_9CLOT|nr:PTS glucose transporter subunit IIA [Clostridium thermobutyricum]ENZ04056.1 PTS system, glucose subfamily, IIA component [Clostridium thermobutyricum]OPX49971.1 glucose-specific phosphotransferase enzyme IIA component [Clostridium thermobutyricum DSM 4928]